MTTAVMHPDGLGRRVVFEDPSLPHQIVLAVTGFGQLGVSCNCLSRGRKRRLPRQLIEARPAWTGTEALAAWRAWHEQRGMIV